jgi:hypothetical protein
MYHLLGVLFKNMLMINSGTIIRNNVIRTFFDDPNTIHVNRLKRAVFEMGSTIGKSIAVVIIPSLLKPETASVIEMILHSINTATVTSSTKYGLYTSMNNPTNISKINANVIHVFQDEGIGIGVAPICNTMDCENFVNNKRQTIDDVSTYNTVCRRVHRHDIITVRKFSLINI